MPADPRLATCVLCPRLCRVACPVATATGREASVPTAIATVLREWGDGRLPASVAAEAAALCVDCGACENHCHLGRPLPALLAEARTRLAEEYVWHEPESLARIEGTAPLVAVCTDERPFATALAAALRTPVATWRTRDRLGVASLERPVGRGEHLARVRGRASQRRLVVADGGVAEVLRAAEVNFSWVWDLVPGIAGTAGSCRSGGALPLACCGAAGPLARVHPDDAARVGRAWVRRRSDDTGRDSRCRDHLRQLGAQTTDAIDALILRSAP